jgi:hypothetical protein
MLKATSDGSRSEISKPGLALLAALSLKERANVLQEHEQVKRVGWRFLESELHVPALRGIVLGVDQQDPSADGLSRLDAPKQRVLQERSPEASALAVAVDCEPGEQDRRHWSNPRLTFERSGGRILRRDLRRSKREIADDGLAIVERRHEDARRI